MRKVLTVFGAASLIMLYILGMFWYGAMKVLDYAADRECVKYQARGYVVYPNIYCTRIESGTEFFLPLQVLRGMYPDGVSF